MEEKGYPFKWNVVRSTTKVWVRSLLRVFQTRGYTLKYKKYVKEILFELQKNYGNLNSIFKMFHHSLFFPFNFRIRAVAGRKVLIPIIIQKCKEVMLIAKLIKSVVKNRTERRFTERLLNELVEISLEKGLTKKKILQYYSDVQKNFVNLRYLKGKPRK